MSAVDRDLLRKLEAAATPGPWGTSGATIYLGGRGTWEDYEGIIYDEGGHAENDAEFIAALRNAAPELLASESPPSDPWNDLLAEARAFEDWYLPTRMSVNAWVGVDTTSGLYGGWTVEGDPLYDEWDESVMTTAAGDTPASVIVDLIRIARDYRSRRDAERVEDERDEQTVAALRDSGVRS